MKFRTRITLLTVLTMMLVLTGVVLVLRPGAVFTTAGILFVIFSAIVFLVSVKNFVLLTDRKTDQQPAEHGEYRIERGE